jgi:predicted GIY-YIG superfamily endonuclease
MSLELPTAVEPYVGTDFTTPAVYALRLHKPANLEAALAEHYAETPPWLDDAVAAEQLVYVGAAARLLDRLEDHVQRNVRTVGLLEVCDIADIFSVWPFDDRDRAFERESGIALALQNEHPSWYVHQR